MSILPAPDSAGRSGMTPAAERSPDLAASGGGKHRRRIKRPLLLLLAVLALGVVVSNWTWARLPAEPAPGGQFVRVDHLRLHYLERAGEGVPVVLIHGLPGTAHDFDTVTPLLAGHRTIAIDRPGFGYSTGGYVPFSRQLEAIHALLGRLGVERGILVGHSYGGTLALGYAERFPEQVVGLVLVDAAAAGLHLSGTDELEAQLVRALQVPVVRQLADLTFSQLLRTLSAESGDHEAFSPGPVNPDHLKRLLSINMTSENLQAFAGETLAATSVIKVIDRRLSTVRARAFVIQGESDRLVNQRYGRRLDADLPHARLDLLAGGHMQPYEHPRAIANAVESISAELERPSRTQCRCDRRERVIDRAPRPRR